jgi:hypothetical protein
MNFKNYETYSTNMKHIKAYESFLVEKTGNDGFAIFTETKGGKNIFLFRGQAGKFFEEKRQGYNDSYGMLFASCDINNAYFYSGSGWDGPAANQIREIVIFEVPNKIARVYGKYIDRARTERDKFKSEGYVGMTSNAGELMADRGEVGLFELYKPIKKWQTTTGSFDPADVAEMIKYGLEGHNIKREKELHELL